METTEQELLKQLDTTLMTMFGLLVAEVRAGRMSEETFREVARLVKEAGRLEQEFLRVVVAVELARLEARIDAKVEARFARLRAETDSKIARLEAETDAKIEAKVDRILDRAVVMALDQFNNDIHQRHPAPAAVARVIACPQ
jgi:hypothetical protein